MTNSDTTRDPVVRVAIDISKHRHDILIAVPGKKRRQRMTIRNTKEDFERLGTRLTGFQYPVQVAFEATGNYHRNLAYYLSTLNIQVNLISSLALARTREALHNSWDKSDPKDAQVILHMMEIGSVQYYHDPLTNQLNDIQELSKTHDIVSRAKTEHWHRILTHYLPLYFPEADRFHRSSRSDWFLAFLENFPTPGIITSTSKEEFVQLAWKVAGKRVNKERLLSDIYDTALRSVGLPVAEDAEAVRMLRMVLAQGRSLIAQRNAIEDRAVALLGSHPDYQLLCTLPGIGPINALTILAEAGDLRRFAITDSF